MNPGGGIVRDALRPCDWACIRFECEAVPHFVCPACPVAYHPHPTAGRMTSESGRPSRRINRTLQPLAGSLGRLAASSNKHDA